MPSRVSGSKSHLGCRQCKVRHLKCDERLPSCGRCQRAKRECSFLQDIGPAPGMPPPFGYYNAPAIALDPVDAWLFNHYVTTTSQFMAHRNELLSLMQQTAPELAKTRPCLMSALNAVSGYHAMALGNDCPVASRDFLQSRVFHHQDRALTLYLHGLRAHPRAEDKVALYLVCVFLPFLSMITFRMLPTAPQDGPSTTPAIDKTIEIFRLLRGSDMILYGDFEEVSKGPLGVLLQILDLHSETTNDPEADDAVNALSVHVLGNEEAVSPTASAHARKADRSDGNDVFRVAIHGLRAMFSALSKNPNDNAQLWGWINGEPLTDYIPLIKERDPRAMIILAYWAVAVHRRRTEWWLAYGLGEGVIREVYSLLPADHHELLAWPAKHIDMPHIAPVT